MKTLEDINAAVAAKFTCDCPQTRLRIRLCQNGTKQYVRQCDRCGKASNSLRTSDLPQIEMRLALPVDNDLLREWQSQINGYRQYLLRQIRAEQRDERFAELAARYHRPDWQELRRKVIQRDRGICQGCGCSGANHAHHLTYDHLGAEFLFELISLCRGCHERIHPHMRTDNDRVRDRREEYAA